MKKLFLAAMVALTAMGANAQIARSTMFQAPERENKTMWYIRAGVSINNAVMNGNLKDDYKDESGKVDTGLGSKAGYDVEFGFNKGIGNSGAYWGMEFGFGTRGYSQKLENTESGSYGNYSYTETDITKESLIAHRFKFTPVMFGYKYSLTDKIKLDAHLGAFISVDMAGTLKNESEYSWTNNYDSSENEFGKESESFGIGDLKTEEGEGWYNRFDAGIQAGIGVWYGRWNLDFTYERGFCSMYNFETKWGQTEKSYSVASSNLLIRLGFAF
ncbi:MAG: PorT family protein [Paramuribaculum sp.]|nr:PorT family protein [Paramuribaculum sp.]